MTFSRHFYKIGLQLILCKTLTVEFKSFFIFPKRLKPFDQQDLKLDVLHDYHDYLVGC